MGGSQRSPGEHGRSTLDPNTAAGDSLVLPRDAEPVGELRAGAPLTSPMRGTKPGRHASWNEDALNPQTPPPPPPPPSPEAHMGQNEPLPK